jgi:ATP-binding cassette subfamily B protein
VGEQGIKLSGGERQRVAIARALIKDARVLVLDEATSSLDSESEHLIQSALWTLVQGRTVIAIAHRLSTIAGMDRVVYLDNGKILEDGPHRELLASNGPYSRLWNRQMGGFIDAA